jgi:2,3-dihydro-2,3-dihydroxybenzoate dehydrogenase
MTFEGKIAVVTGAASGIGRATALSLGRHGARVALFDLNADGMAETAAQLQQASAESQIYGLDITNQEQVKQTVAQVVQSWGPLHIMVNAAGINQAGPTSYGPGIAVSEAEWDRMMEVNLMGTVHCALAAAQHMRPLRRGRIVNVASVAGVVPRVNMTSYCVSKAAVRMFTKCLALELAAFSITVNAVAPGPTQTPMLGSAVGDADPQAHERMLAGNPEIYRLGVPLGKLGQPEDVASAIQYFASDEAHHLTGVILNVDGMAQLT